MRRRWGPIVTGVALALTFGILVGLGTLGPGSPGQDEPAAQSSDAPPDWMRKLGPGETFYEPPGALHAVSRNGSSTQVAKYLVIQVSDPTQPQTVAE